MIINILILIILIGLTTLFGLIIQKNADIINELQTNNDIITKNIDELRYNIGLLESKIKQSSTKKNKVKNKVNDVTRLKADKVQ